MSTLVPASMQHQAKRLLYLLFTLSFFTLHIQAQEEIEDGEAFYIYRNDGEFDGFFYDQVQEIRYSRLDLDGMEHTAFVVQEVVTEDSIFRIPLAAIDSVSFVQPELRFSRQVRHMDLLGMTQYVTTVDGMTLTFDSTLPFDKTPKVGDVLLGFTGILEENGFGGRVSQVHNTGSGLVVVCEKPTQLSDVFDQFITVEQIGTNGGGQVRRRMAGYSQLMTSARRSPSGPSLTLVDINLNTQIPLIPDILSSGGMHCNVGVNASFKMRLTTVMQITSESYFFKARFNEDYNLQLGVSLGLHGSNFLSFSLLEGIAFKFPATCPLFEVRPVPEFGLRYGGELSAKLSFPGVSGSLRQTFTMDSDHKGISYSGNENDKLGDDSEPQNIFDSMDGNFVLSGFMQLGIKQPCMLYTNGWFDWIFSAGMGMDLFLGPKLEGAINLSGKSLLSGDDIYSLANSYLALSCFALDYEAYGEYTDAIMSPNKLKWTFADGSFSLFPKLEMYLMPHLNLKSPTYNQKSHQIDVDLETNQCKVFMPHSLGFGLFDEEYGTTFYSNYVADVGFAGFAPTDLNESIPAKDLKAGRYKVAPMLRALGKEYPIKSLAKSIDVPPHLELSQDTIKEETAAQVSFKTNAEKVTIYPTEDWIHAELTGYSLNGKTGTINITLDKNTTLFTREADLEVLAEDTGTGAYIVEHIHFIQPSAGVVSKACYGITYMDDSGEFGALFSDEFDVNFERSGDIITVTGTGKLPGDIYANEWGTEPSICEKIVSINLVADLNPENPMILNGSLTFYNKLKLDASNGGCYIHDDFETKASASFSNIPLIQDYVVGHLFFDGSETSIVSLTGSLHEISNGKQCEYCDPQSYSVFKTLSAPPAGSNGGIWVELILEP